MSRMSTPLPVPSKAALQALRGIALGTSCAIGVIIEDRRRRIGTLKTAIENHNKLKTSKRYHSNAAYALDLDDNHSQPRPLEVHLHPRYLSPHEAGPSPESNPSQVAADGQQSRESKPSFPTDPSLTLSPKPTWGESPYIKSLDTEPPNTEKKASGSNSISEAKELQRKSGIVSGSQASNSEDKAHFTQSGPTFPTAAQFSLGSKQATWGQNPYAKSYIQELRTPPRPDIRKLIEPLALLLDSCMQTKLHDIVQPLVNLCRRELAPEECDVLLEFSARVCKQCQAHGMWRDAQHILCAAAGLPVTEAQFFAHDPIPVIESYLSDADGNNCCSPHNLETARSLFLTRFTDQPLHRPDFEKLGARLIREAMALRALKRLAHFTDGIFHRVLTTLDEPSSFIAWYIDLLVAQNAQKSRQSAINVFILNYAKCRPTEMCLKDTVQKVLDSVYESKGYKAAQVIKALIRMEKAGNPPPQSQFISKLLESHWSWYRNMPAFKDLWSHIESSGILDRINQSEVVQRTAADIFLELGDMITSQVITKALSAANPNTDTDIKSLGISAVVKANAGDWSGVSDAMDKIQYRLRKNAEKRTKQTLHRQALIKQERSARFHFRQVWKVYSEQHTMAESRTYVESFFRSTQLTMDHHILAMVARTHAKYHDWDGFLSWLSFCTEKAGVQIDTMIVNIVLDICRENLHHSENDLRELISRMQQLFSGFDDSLTRRIMNTATAQWAPQHNIDRFDQDTRPIPSAESSKPTPGFERTVRTSELYEVMRRGMAGGRFSEVLGTYETAMKEGMPFCSRCFRLAVMSCLSLSGPDRAIKFMRSAQQKGYNVDVAISTLLRHQLQHSTGKMPAGGLRRHLRELIGTIMKSGINFHHSVLTQAALIYIKKMGRSGPALELCNLAMQKSGTSNPCFSREGFRVYLHVYTKRFDLERLTELFDAMFCSDFVRETATYKTLRDCRRQLANPQNVELFVKRDQVLKLLNETVLRVKNLRAEHQTAKPKIEAETLRIMAAAVKEAACKPPVDILIEAV